MISNTSTPYKLKTSKRDYQDNQNEENYDDADTGPPNDSYRKQFVYPSRDGRYKSARSRQTDFKHSRMGSAERRGYGRGRGAPILRREREFFENNSYVQSRKYHDSLSRSTEPSSMYYRSKCYEPEKKTEIKFNFPEDTRISKLLRRLSMETDQQNSLTISKKLLEVLLLPDNSNYVRKAFHILGESMLDILHSAPGLIAKEEAARALGRMGYIMGQENDFARFQDWMFTKILNVKDDIKYLFMKALKETLKFETNKQVLQDHAKSLMHDLVSTIEILENAMLFKTALDVLITLVELYPEEFHSQFRDAIDIFLGWHVDLAQPLTIVEFISKSLQRIKRHFQINIDFSSTLVVHFFDDIEGCVKDLEKYGTVLNTKGVENNTLDYLTVFILALNTVLKCLEDTLQPSSNEIVNTQFITDCLIQLIKTVSSVLETCISDNLIIATNENISLLLEVLTIKSTMLHNTVYALIDLELSLLDKFSDATVISTLLMISKVIKELAANLPADLVENLVGPMSKIVKLRSSPFLNIQEAIVNVYQALLNLKNIPFLQEAYRYILGDLEIAYKQIVPTAPSLCQNNPFAEITTITNPEVTVLFLLRCISQLANSSRSIIGLWALKPSMLELLAVLLEPYNIELSNKAPSLQYSLLYLLYSHCKCYNHFIASSSLVSKQDNCNKMGLLGLSDVLIGDVTSQSPNSGNFAIILNVLYQSLSTAVSCETMLLLLQWLNDVLLQSETYLIILYNCPEFSKVAEVLVKCGYTYDSRIVLAVNDNLKRLLNKKELSWSNSFLTAVNDLCILHMNSTNTKIRDTYTNLSKNVPWDLTIIQFNKIFSIEQAKLKYTDLSLYNNFTIVLAQHLHLSGSVYGEMMPLHFTTFMKYLLQGEEQEEFPYWMEDIFTGCWPIDIDPQINFTNMEGFRSLALNSQAVLNNWITFEAAQLCVNSKLRTSLGKPNETFTSFENALKQVAKDVMKAKVDSEEASSTPNIDLKRVRLLLQFMEHLEKAIYNAAEGCAIAMPPPSKPVRTFFHTNASTCKEWLSRIRIIIVHIALHAGQSTVALRHGQVLLANIVASNRTKTVEFERAIMYVTLALLNLRESEALYGLYNWCKKVADRRFEWVKYSADQANKKYEIASNSYKMLFESIIKANQSGDGQVKNVSDIDSQIQHFMHNQILNCYKELNSWEDIVDWEKQGLMEGINDNGIKYSFTTINLDCVRALSDTEMVGAFNKLNSWYDDETTSNCWSVYDTLYRTETNLYNIALNISSEENSLLLDQIKKNLIVIKEGLQDNLISLPSEFLQNFSIMHYIANGLKTVLINSSVSNAFLVSENFENDIEKIDSTVLSKILWWSEYFSKDHHVPGFNSFCSSLRLHIIRRARKEKNFNLATLHINKFLIQEELFKIDDTNQKLTLENIGILLTQKTGEFSTCTIDFAKAIKETIKLLHATDISKQLVFNLCASASTAISKNAELFCSQDMRRISSKILLKLSTWLQGNEQSMFSVTDITSPLVKLLMVLPEIGIENVGMNIIPVNDMAIGKLLQFSVHQCPNLAKSWFAFGTWCYRWGRKIMDHSSNVTSPLTEEEKLAVQQCLPLDTCQDDLMQIIEILSCSSTTSEDDIDSNEVKTSKIIRDQLKMVPVLYGAQEDELEGLVQFWRNSQKRIYAYYEISAESYFKFLQFVTDTENINKSTECNSLTATLRLLRLIVKHALILQNVLENGLASTPTQPWKVIIPQLFSRLNHPEDYVRQRVSEFLCRVAEDSPHLITFPAVVGAVEGGVKFDFSEISIAKDCFSQSNEVSEDSELPEIDEDIYESDSEETKSALQSCFKSMVETLSKQAPETITQVELLVKELRRITLLWDELWLGTLIQYNSEIIQRQHQLEVEIEKVNDNANLTEEEKLALITEKYRIITKPIVFILEQLQLITNAEPETPYEKQFQERYLDIIKEVLDKLKNPSNPDKPQESWQSLKSLQNKFQQKAHKRTAYTLKMQDISPLLASMKDTVIAMPGLATTSKVQVNISNVSNRVSILPTKTKPKKLIFYGSDGQTYTYLFKGLEDLHLDERIMQFLSIANTMMAQGADESTHNLYRARHYSVIPLGPRSGLISWVDGTTPVFALYKRWQQREAAKANTKTGSGQRSNSNPNIGVLRPSELFYNKLNPLLQEHGVKNIENRKEWPLSILKQVLKELMAETPNNLLARELWCHSINAGEWWQIVRKYSYSVAVMSTIGYIIGLGDRHLDNVLVDLTSGEVVHIDYNVCFEKGKTLRVPEKVPFRLTPNIEEALGITGVEGIFRLACESVLKTMKKGRETLLTLLEAFVYDPLVDWTVGGEGLAETAFRGVAGSSLTRQSRKDLEKEVTLSMYNIRCTEMKINWNLNKEEILQEIPCALEKLEKLLQKLQEIAETRDILQDLHQQMALVKEAEANGTNNHFLYTLPSRYESYRKVQDAVESARYDLQVLASDIDIHMHNYSDALKLLERHQYSHWIVELNVKNHEKCKIFDIVKEFLQNAGQSNMVTQCEQSEIEIEQLKEEQNELTKSCLELLQDYWTAIAQCPTSYREDHRIVFYLNWLNYLQENKNVAACDTIYQQWNAFLINSKTLCPAKPVMEFSYLLNSQCKEITNLMTSQFTELKSIKETNEHAESIYNKAKAAISSFENCEKDGFKALKYIVLNELCKQNKDFLSTEMAVSRNSSFVLKLMSQKGGDWFLDDLVWHSSNTLEFISYLFLQQNSYIEDTLFQQVVNGMKAVNNVYKSLHELYCSFHTIILPETMKKILGEEPSVIEMISDINNLILNVGTPLSDLITQLEKQLTCIVMEMEIAASHNYIMDLVTQLKTKYLVKVNIPSENLNQGMMLLLGFNGLFDKLNEEFQNLINTLGILDIPQCWRKVDQVKQARSLAPPLFNIRVKSVLDNIFLLKRLQTISDFFNLATEMCKSFKTPTTPVLVLKDEHLENPVKKYISDFIARQFLGISTETIAYMICILLQNLGLNVTSEIEQKDIGAEHKVSLDDLNKKAGNLCLKRGIFNQNVLAQASSLVTNLKSSWNTLQDIKQKDLRFSLMQSTLARLKSQIATHSWLHEKSFTQNCAFNSHVLRSKFLFDLRNNTSSLNDLINKMSEACDRQKSLINSVNSRLNWAAGANPDVNQVVSEFEDVVRTRDKRLELENQIALLVFKTCTCILKHELLRMQSLESDEFDKKFLSIMDKWHETCQLIEAEKIEVTQTEKNIMEMFTSNMYNNPKWVTLVSEKISDIITGTHKKLSDQKEDSFVYIDSIHTNIENLKSLYEKHTKLMLEVKTLIKSMAKIEDCSANTLEFMANYRQYTENFSSLLHYFKKETNEKEVSNIIKNLEYLKENTEFIYDSVMDLEGKGRHRPTLVRQEGVSLSPIKTLPPKQDSTTKVQQRNAYAMGVWRRVRLKLEGRDPDPGKKYTNQEQVDYIIREATNLDNLALLYEGWTPWV